MKKFIYKLVIFCIAPLAILMPLSYIVNEGLHKSRHFFYSEWNDIFYGNINADMLIMGSSRAWVQFSPQILDSALHTNAYNLGMDAASLDLQYERLKIYLQHNPPPKYIIQEVGLNLIFISSAELPHFQQFLPYLKDSSMWRVFSTQYPNASVLDRYFPLYKYNNQLPVIKEGIKSYLGRGMKGVKTKGYLGQTLTWDSSLSNFIKTKPAGINLRVEAKAQQLFEDYIMFCKNNNIKLIMVYAPFYYEVTPYFTNLDSIKNLLTDISHKYDLPYLDYSQNFLDSNKAYFYNSQHLNKEGSEIFTRMLAHDLKPYCTDTAATFIKKEDE